MKRYLALIAATILVAGCGSDSSSSNDDARADKAHEARVKRAAQVVVDDRATQIDDYFYNQRVDGRNEYMLDRIRVQGGHVTLTTELYPKPENRPYYTGICTHMINFASVNDWVEDVRVEDEDGYVHAKWSKGDSMCFIYSSIKG